MQRSCAIIIPVYNEDGAIADTVTRLQTICRQVPDYAFEIICINDGSSDRSGEILAELPGITVLTHDVNRGYGAALRTGLDYCSQEWVFITDAAWKSPAFRKPGINNLFTYSKSVSAANWPMRAEIVGSRSTAARVTPGAICLSSSSHLIGKPNS
jgi:hypothetical protein